MLLAKPCSYPPYSKKKFVPTNLHKYSGYLEVISLKIK